MGDSENVLDESFGLFLNKEYVAAKVSLQSDSVNIRCETLCFGNKKTGKTDCLIIPLCNVIGCQIPDEKNCGKNQKNDEKWRDSPKETNPAFLRIHFFKFKNVIESGENLTLPKSSEIVFKVTSAYTYEQHLEIAKRWKDKLSQQVYLSHTVCPQNELPQKSRLERRKRLLILVNPKSGPGKALKIFRESVEPLLQKSDLLYDLVVTKRPNHGQDLVANEVLGRWSAIVIISGDGLLFEVFQGIFKRSDWKQSKNIPIAVIAGGSGNGLARTLCHEAKQSYEKNGIEAATLSLIKGSVRPMDMICVQTKSGKTIYSFLSIGMGLLSDVDIESERLRFLGEPRFVLWSIYKVLRTRNYRVVVTYKPYGTTKKFEERETDALSQLNDDDENDGCELTPLDPFTEFERQFTEVNPSQPWCCKEDYDSVQDIPLHAPKKSLNLPPFSEPLKEEEGWVRLDEKFLIVYAMNVEYIGSDLKAAPGARSDDGAISLLLVKKGLSKLDIARFLLGLETGQHLDLPLVQMVKCEAFRLEPVEAEKGFITVDGELLESYEALQAQVLPKFARIVA